MKRYIQKIVQLLKPARQQKNEKPYEFIKWLTFANAGMLDNGNIYCFEYAIENLVSDKPIIEIGSFCGLSTNLINFYLRKNNKTNKLITCDKWIFEGADGGTGLLGESRLSHREYREFVRDTYIRNVTFFSKENLPYTIEVFSDEFFSLWKDAAVKPDVLGRQVKLGGEISFAFIDGNHTYEFAKRDFENVDKYLEPGGFILFDDSSSNSIFGLHRLMLELEKEGNYEVVIKNPNYLFRKKV